MESKSRAQLLRDEFEAWLAPSWSRETYRDDDGDVEYLDDWVQGAWMGWIASRAALVVELPSADAFDSTWQFKDGSEETLRASGITVKGEGDE